MSSWFNYSSTPWVSVDAPTPTNPLIGMIRYQSSTGGFQINTGHDWQSFYFPQSVTPTGNLEELLNWVESERSKDRRIRELATKNSSVKLALDAVEKATEQLNLLALLSEEPSE